MGGCMEVEGLVVAGGTLLISALLTGAMRRLALARGILDAPNERSSHTQVMPRGGGVAIVAACVACLLWLSWREAVDSPLVLALVGGGIPLAWIGFLDDRRSVSVGARLLVHVLAAAWAIYVLGGVAPLQFGARVFELGPVGNLLAVVAIVWVVNLFNFMDGIDGIAGSEAVFIGALGCLLGFFVLRTPSVSTAAAVFACASGGFLLWNWPPAKIFMGDAGSGFLGFFIAVLALAATRQAPAAPFVWLILGGVFFVDATVTFARRLVRRVSLHQAHREHAYQRLSRRWGSHRKVVLSLLTINLCWLAPCAWYAAAHPTAAASMALLALAPLVVAALAGGSGRPE
jgi:Fuc2NAc and GlcNAc transferase